MSGRNGHRVEVLDVVEAATPVEPEPVVSLDKTTPEPWPPETLDETDETDGLDGEDIDDEDEDETTSTVEAGPVEAGGPPVLPARPVRPWWLVDPKGAVAWAVRYVWYWSLGVAVQLPGAAARAVLYTPRGVWRIGVALYGWANDADSAARLAATQDLREWLAIDRARKDRNLGVRAAVAAGLGLVLAAGLVAGLRAPTIAGRVVTVVVFVAVAGYRGRPLDRAFIDVPAVAETKAWRPSPDMITTAFADAGLSRDGPVEFIAPGIVREGEGWAVTVKLPAKVKASTALGRREELAASLDIDENRVFLDRVRGDKGSARRVSLWLAARDPWAVAPPPSPLGAAPAFSMWDPIPLGLDARGRPVGLPLVWSSLLVGARPRQGKTVAGLGVGAAAALDPYCRLIVADLKGGRDWKRAEQVAYWYGSGIRDVVMESLLAVLRDVLDDVERRFETMQGLPDDVCPENKLTPAMSRNRRLNMPLVVIVIDEVHRGLVHKRYGTDLLEVLTDLAKVAPAAGVMLALLTQKPSSEVIPDDLRGQIGTRLAFNVRTWQASDTILGAGMYRAGVDASKVHGKGVGILLATDDSELSDAGAVMLRTHRHDHVFAGACARGRQNRIDARTLEGAAAGEAVITETPSLRLLDDIAAVFGPGETELWNETVVARLATTHPDLYDGWAPATLTGALKPYAQVRTGRQIWGTTPAGEGRNRRGITRQDVLDALAERIDRPPTGR